MHRPSLLASALVAGVAIGLSACGGGSSSSSSGGSSNNNNNGGGGGGSGSSFCQQAAQATNEFNQLGAGLSNTSPGATPSLDNFKHIFASGAQAIDNLDGSAPSEISADFHKLRVAYDQANQQMQAATSMQDLSSFGASLSSPDITTANTNVTNYLKNTCGISSGASTAASPSAS